MCNYFDISIKGIIIGITVNNVKGKRPKSILSHKNDATANASFHLKAPAVSKTLIKKKIIPHFGCHSFVFTLFKQLISVH